ncbi:MAG: response regulator [Deltaproteobacteria bacterium]|nr:response regulator [Deltaproteobacteria bacterium]
MIVGARVLIVDDNKDLAENLAEILGDLGYRAEVALDGSRALARLAEDCFSLVITDLKMPGLDGVQVLERVRAHWPELPVILMTAYAQEDLLARAAEGEAAANAIFSKPLDLDDLLESVAQLCPPDRPVLLVEDDDDLRETLVEALSRTCPVEIFSCADGAEARRTSEGRAFSVALLDLRLPDEDGLDLGTWLLAQQGEGQLQVVYITGHRGDFDAALQEVLASPAVHLLEKPFPPERLLAVIEEIL